ncbi:MAG: ABC transporter permease, partial [Actinomyces sp.]
VTLDSSSQTEVGFLLTVQGARAVLFVGLAVAGIVALSVAAARLGDAHRTGRLGVQLLNALVVVVLAFVVRSESASTKFRAELFTVLLLVATFMVAAAVLELLFERRRHADEAADRLGRILASVGVVIAVVGVAINLLYSTAEENAATTAVTQFRIGILWFIVFSVVATWVLLRTRFGSWTFAVGGNAPAARSVGVPAARTKTTLFMIVSAAAWLVGMLLAFRLNSVQASTGDGKEFEYIIAAVVGGNLLTGGYGSAVGAAVGGLIIAMSRQGIPLARWNSNWQFLFLGVILLLAVLVNNYVRTKAEASR